MKNISKDGRTWFSREAGGKTNIGFTQDFLRELDECWHIMAGATSKVTIKEAQPLCSVETNDGLFSVASPASGVITFFNNKAMNFPDKITSEEVIAVVSEKAEEDALSVALRHLQELEAVQAVPPPQPRAERARLQPRAAAPIQWGANERQVVLNVPQQPLRFFDDFQQADEGAR